MLVAPPPPTLALLNQSEYLPNQLLHMSVGLLVFFSLMALSWQRLPWSRQFVKTAKYLRVAAYFHLGLAVGILVFKLSSADPVEQYLLTTFPSLERFHPFEPTAHMIEEFAPMGGYAYIAVFYLRKNFVNVIERPRLSFVLGTAFHVYAVCWVTALAIALYHPFPMTGLYTELDPWSVPYRAAILLPGVFYCSIFTFVFMEAALQKDAPRSAIRLTFLSLGSLSWALICAEQFAWAVIHALAPEPLREQIATPHVVAESILYTFMGAFWLGALLIGYRKSSTQESISDHRDYQRLDRELKGELQRIYRQLPEWNLTRDRMHRAAQELGLCVDRVDRAIHCVQLVALTTIKGSLYRAKLADWCSLRESLARRLPKGSPEHSGLCATPLAHSADPALLLTNEAPVNSLASESPELQLAAAVLTEQGLLPEGKTYHLDGEVHRVWSATADAYF